MIADDMTAAVQFSRYKPPEMRPVLETHIPTSTMHSSVDGVVPQHVKQIQLLNEQKAHIILCGAIPNGLDHFMIALRRVSSQTVVYLHPHKPNPIAQKVFNDFDDFFLMQGSPMSVSDLAAAGAGSAEVVVIFPGHSLLDTESAAHGFGDMFTVYVANIISEHFAKTRCFAELSDSGSMHFLKDRGMSSDPHTLWPSYCSGSVYLSNLFDALLAQAYYNNDLIEIINCLIGAPSKNSKSRSPEPPNAAEVARLPSSDPWHSPLAAAHRKLHESKYQECKKLKPIQVLPLDKMLCGAYCFAKVPAQYDGCTYQEVYNDLVLNHSCLALGIYRAVISLPQMFEYCSGGLGEINVHNDHSE